MGSRNDDCNAPSTSTVAEAAVGLVADIGATYARFALVRSDGSTTPARIYALTDYQSLPEAINAYLAEKSPPARPAHAVLAVASPIIKDEVAFTNHPWEFSVNTLRQQMRFTRLRVVNDFAAAAMAIPHLAETDRTQIGPGAPLPNSTAGIIGPGSGLGVGALTPSPSGPVVIAGEGGHVTMPPANEQESAILDLMRKRYDHVSAERLLSGPGLVNLYNALCELAELPAAAFTPAQITSPRIWDEDPRAKEATTIFCAMLGTVAGNLALTLGAHGGIYVAGGIVPRLGSFFAQSGFRDRFEAKGRMRGYLAMIPTYLIVHPVPALIGAAVLLRQL